MLCFVMFSGAVSKHISKTQQLGTYETSPE